MVDRELKALFFIPLKGQFLLDFGLFTHIMMIPVASRIAACNWDVPGDLFTQG